MSSSDSGSDGGGICDGGCGGGEDPRVLSDESLRCSARLAERANFAREESVYWRDACNCLHSSSK